MPPLLAREHAQAALDLKIAGSGQYRLHAGGEVGVHGTRVDRRDTDATTPALYQRSTRTVFVNAPNFSTLSRAEQEAVIMHEVGHAHLHATGGSQAVGECIEADLLGVAGAVVNNPMDFLEMSGIQPFPVRSFLERWWPGRGSDSP